jgi:hypothetical protein
MSDIGHVSQLGFIRGPIAAAAAVALTAAITAFFPASTVLAEPPMPTPAAVGYTSNGNNHPAPTHDH